MSKTKAFRPPEDIRQWWCAPHCGPGTLDTNGECGFCGANVIVCALALTDAVKHHPEWVHDGSILGDGHDDPEDQMACGGCGFWCHKCGRFWAQDSCGNNSGADHASADGLKLVVKDGNVHCVCGQLLMRVRPMEDE
jgi:hypothetical protein